MYDIIGDIHGHYDVLTILLKKMGYQYDGISWGHRDRKVLLVGDYIDRHKEYYMGWYENCFVYEDITVPLVTHWMPLPELPKEYDASR